MLLPYIKSVPGIQRQWSELWQDSNLEYSNYELFFLTINLQLSPIKIYNEQTNIPPRSLSREGYICVLVNLAHFTLAPTSTLKLQTTEVISTHAKTERRIKSRPPYYHCTIQISKGPEDASSKYTLLYLYSYPWKTFW